MTDHSEPFKRKALGLAIALSLSSLATSAHADALQDLQAKVDVLLKKVADLEQKQVTATPANVVTGGATKGSFKLPGSDTSVTLGGYVKLDAIYSDPSAGVGKTADQEFEPGSIPVGPSAGANERHQIKLHARQSRLNVKTSTPTAWGDMNTFLEFDLFGASGNEIVSNSNSLRVRHAYGSIGGLLAGQTWSTFMDVGALPETLDFGGPAGEIFVRQAQVRWTQPFSAGQWSLALENPASVVTLPTGASFQAHGDRVPDIAGNINFNTSMGRYSMTGLVRQIRVDSASAPASQHQKWGGAIGFNGVVPIFGRDDVRFSANVGNAIGRYSVGFFTDAILDTSGQIDLPTQWAAIASYRHFWSDQLRSTVALSGKHANNPFGTFGSVNKSAQSAHLNLIWSPVANTNLGMEYIYGRRETENGQTGKLNRLQASAQYSF
jgi:hypothetical protein